MKKDKIIYFKVVFNFFIECNFCGPRTSNPAYPPLDGPEFIYKAEIIQKDILPAIFSELS